MPDQPPDWDDQRAAALVGRIAIIGITYLEADGETVASQIQLHGTIAVADRTRGIQIDCAGVNAGRAFWLPPQESNFSSAQPGEYRLSSTGEVVVNPDVIGQWTVTKPPAL